MKCSKCQFENPEGAKFCGECGEPLTQSATQPLKDLSFDEKLAKIQMLGKAMEVLSDCGADGWVEKYKRELATIQ